MIRNLRCENNDIYSFGVAYCFHLYFDPLARIVPKNLLQNLFYYDFFSRTSSVSLLIESQGLQGFVLFCF